MTRPTLGDIRANLLANVDRAGSLPCHAKAFRGWVLGRTQEMKEAVDEAVAFTGQARHPEHVATLGFGAAVGLLNANQVADLRRGTSAPRGAIFLCSGTTTAL